MSTWRKLISEEMEENGDTWDLVEASTFAPGDLDYVFDNGYGGDEGCWFTLWTKSRVYFPVDYDGAEHVRSAPRNPCSEKTRHVGGGGGCFEDPGKDWKR